MSYQLADMILRHVRTLGGEQEPSDAELVRRFADYRDEAAFARLVRRHGAMVLGVCRRVLRDWHAAEDAFQAAFLVLARKASSIRKQASVSSWLHSVARRLAIRAKRTAARREERQKQLAAMQPPASQNASATDASWRDIAAMLDEELARLPDKYRAPLVLCYLEGKTQDQAAQHLDWPLRTFTRRLEQGRTRLRGRLARRGVALSTGLCAAALSQHLAAAAVPPGLTQGLIQAAALFAASNTAGATVSQQAVLLAQSFLKSMGVRILALAGVLLLTVTVWAVGFGWNDQPAPSAKDPAQERGHAANLARPEAKRAEQPAVSKPTLAQRPRDPGLHFQHRGPVTCVAFAPDGETAASGGDTDKAIRLWETATGKERYHIDVGSSVLALAYARDGKTLAAGTDDKLIRLFETATGGELRVMQGHTREVSALIVAPDGNTLISGSHDGTVRLWDMATGKELHRFAVPGHIIHSLALSVDGHTLAAGCEEVRGNVYHPIRLWDLRTRAEIHLVIPRYVNFVHTGPVRAIAFAPDGARLASGGMDGCVLLWDTHSGKMLREYRDGVIWPVQALAFSPNGDTLAIGSLDCRICSWETATGKPRRRYEGHRHSPGPARTSGVSSIAFSTDGTSLLSGASDGRVRMWDVSTGKER